MNLRIRGCKDTRLQASTHKPKDMRMWGCEDANKYLEYTNLKIWGCKDARIQARTHETKDMRMQGYKQLHRCKIHISISISTIYVSVYMIYISNDTMKSTFIFWCTIHQTLPKKLSKKGEYFAKKNCQEINVKNVFTNFEIHYWVTSFRYITSYWYTLFFYKN